MFVDYFSLVDLTGPWRGHSWYRKRCTKHPIWSWFWFALYPILFLFDWIIKSKLVSHICQIGLICILQTHLNSSRMYYFPQINLCRVLITWYQPVLRWKPFGVLHWPLANSICKLRCDHSSYMASYLWHILLTVGGISAFRQKILMIISFITIEKNYNEYPFSLMKRIVIIGRPLD